MSTLVDLFPRTAEDDVIAGRVIEAEPEQCFPAEAEIRDSDSFAEAQIRAMVRQLFLPGWPKPAHQVVFSAVDRNTDIREICLRVGEVLSTQVSGITCVVEANPSRFRSDCAVESYEPFCRQTRFGALRDSSQQLSSKLWLVPRTVFLGENENGFSAAWLRGRLAELQLEFDYTVLHGPAAGSGSEAALLGHLCDGVVLVLEANSTRRVAAQKAKERLFSANARLLGTVLSERTFPIPEALYRKL
jgi:hypothetical protein